MTDEEFDALAKELAAIDANWRIGGDDADRLCDIATALLVEVRRLRAELPGKETP